MKGKKLVDNVNRWNRGSLIVIERTNKNEIHLFQVLTVGWYGFTMFFPLKSFLPHEWLFQNEFLSITSRLRPWEWNRLSFKRMNSRRWWGWLYFVENIRVKIDYYGMGMSSTEWRNKSKIKNFRLKIAPAAFDMG